MVVDFKSRMAEALVVPPFGLISIDCAEVTSEVKIANKASNVFMGMFFIIYWFYSLSDKCH